MNKKIIKSKYCILIICCIAIFFNSCSKNELSVEVLPFGQLSTGEKVSLFRLKNGNGSFIDVIDYGCRVVRICVPDREGNIEDIVPGYDNIKDFESGPERFFGSIIGRFGNRIADGKFILDGKPVQLPCNETLADRPGHLHGGKKGFDRVMWNTVVLEEKDKIGVQFSRISPDGEEGYPGNLDCKVIYWWTKDNVWQIEYTATTDKPTIVNLSNHTYFNLKGANGGYVLDNIMSVESDQYLPNNIYFVPSGEPLPVENTPFDLRKPNRIDHAIDTPNEHFNNMRGFSVTWVLRNQSGKLAKAADLWEPVNGRGIETWTTEPGLLTYTGRLFSDKVVGKGGIPIQKFGGMLLETLHYPDSPNHPEYPTTELRPGEVYYSSTKFIFYAK